MHALTTLSSPPPRRCSGGGGPRRPKVTQSSRQHYCAQATVKQQVEARTYFATMMQVAFQQYRIKLGDAPITWETTWADLFPPDPPEALKRYYGEPSGFDIAALATDLQVSVDFAPPLARCKPVRAPAAPAAKRVKRK
jgi:hypothetical protein